MAAHEPATHQASAAAGDPASRDSTELDPTAIALSVVGRFESGRFDEAQARFAPQLRAIAPAAALADAWHNELNGRRISRRGPVTLRTRADGLITATVPVRTQDGGIDVLMSIDGDGILHGLRFAAGSDVTWTAPDYVSTQRFEEHEVVIGGGAGTVPGTLTLPQGRRRSRGRITGGVPAVILLAGGGPFDRDGTAGPNKPLKDLAWGLATRGIAALRFDKATSVDTEGFYERGFTLTDEYVTHAAAAVELLQASNAVDPKRVFVLGHSAGGKAAPRVAREQPSIAGMILLAGDAYPMHESAMRVARHVCALNPSPVAEAAVARMSEQAARAADPALDTSTPAAQLPFGLPAAYWLDLRDYDPVATAATAGRPMFIAQGGRDYQVTVGQDLSLWREGLRGRSDVSFRVYPADDHLFFPGTEAATPASYQIAQHVDPVLISDIAEWIRAQTGRR